MTLTTGARLGPYEISSLIGAGGMGEVYKARDTRLGRDVAIKVLPASFASDHERLRRFEQEAQAVAALSHPNILAVYDIGQSNGTNYLVSELLEGESLRELLARGPISHRKAAAYAAQVAHGLAAAHSKNIAHRDLKPDNIFITNTGQVKILDFGLAKSMATTPAHPIASPADATVAVPGPATDAGTVMGTAGYMSPEQVRGIAVDYRTDIFSFGAVLYEMLTGVRAFKRDTTAETMTAILHEEPPEPASSARQLPPALDRIVRHCLEKSPDQRFQSARDLAFDLESASSITPSSEVPVVAAPPHSKWLYYGPALAALALVALLAGWKLTNSRPPATGSQFHQLTYRRGDISEARFSTDGQTVYYTAAWESSKPEIYTVPANGNGGHSLGIENARLFAVSKTGEIAVELNPIRYSLLITSGNLARVASGSTGTPKPEIENVSFADYTPDGSALAIVRYLPGRSICQIEYPVGHAIYSAPAIDGLRFSPNGKYLAFTLHSTPYDDRGQIMIIRTNGDKVAASPEYASAQGLAWTPSSDEVWVSSPLESGEIHALSVSGKSRTPLSVPGRLFLRDISSSGEILTEQGIFHLGTVVSTGNQASQHDLSWLNYGYLRAVSDDGKMILFEEEGLESPKYTVYVRNVDDSPATPIGEGYGSALSHDKNWVLATRLNFELWLLPVGPGEPRQVSPKGFSCAQASFLSDNKHIVFIARKDGRPYRTWILDLDGGDPKPITPEGIFGYRVSPDDKWLLATAGSNISAPTNTLIAPLSGGTPVPIAGLKPHESPLGWTSDDRLFVEHSPQPGDVVAAIAKLDPRTGASTTWRSIPIIPIDGVGTNQPPIFTPDGSMYAIGYQLATSDLYTISGPR